MLELSVQGKYELIKRLPTYSGVYLLWSGNEAVYAGQSLNIRERILSAHTLKPFDRVQTIEVKKPAKRTALERWIIFTVRPCLNKDVPSEKLVTKTVREFYIDNFFRRHRLDPIGNSKKVHARMLEELRKIRKRPVLL